LLVALLKNYSAATLLVGMTTLGWLVVWVHLLVLDKLFLWQGKVAGLKK